LRCPDKNHANMLVLSVFTHYTSACPNKGDSHEFKMFSTIDANGGEIPIQSKTEPFISYDGKVKGIIGSGLGINIDPDYVKTHKALYG
jgi:hypothetical protein